MSEQFSPTSALPPPVCGIDQIEALVKGRLRGRVRQFHLLIRDGGLVLKGQASTYYAKQLVQHAVISVTDMPIWANEIEVS